MMRALIAAAAGVAVLVSGAAWLRREADRDSVMQMPVATRCRPLAFGVPYCLNARRERLEFVLPGNPQDRYLLVVASLGDPQRLHRVKIRSDPADSPRPIDAQPLKPWEARSSSRAMYGVNRSGGRKAEGGDRRSEIGGRKHRRRSVSWLSAFRLPPSAFGFPLSAFGLRLSAFRFPLSTFHLHVTDGPLDDPRQYAEIKTREICRGRRVAVLLDSAEPLNHRLEQTTREIVRLYERKVLPRTRQLLGPHTDVDGDGRLTILLTPRLGRLQGGRTSLGGLVRPADFRTDVPAPFSSHCDLLFLNANVTPGPRLHALLAHEYAHVVTFSRRASAAAAVEDDWLSEGIAHVCEHLHHAGWTNLDHRVARFLESPQQCPLVVANYYESGLWRDDGCRGATFLFLRWCVDQFGEAFLRQLADAEVVGVRNVELASGHTFEDLFRRWCLAVYCAGIRDDVRTAISPAVPQFHSLTLRGQLGKRRLAGAKADQWRRTDSRRTLAVRGTAAAFVEIRCDSPGSRRFQIRAGGDARLQVTLVRLPDKTSGM
jgi:hypothetical protein